MTVLNKSIILFAVLYAVSLEIYAAEFQSKPSNSKEHPDQCYDEGSKTAYKPGELVHKEGVCIKITCNEDLSFTGYTCSPINVPDTCELTKEDLTKPYPECCPQPKCLSVSSGDDAPKKE